MLRLACGRIVKGWPKRIIYIQNLAVHNVAKEGFNEEENIQAVDIEGDEGVNEEESNKKNKINKLKSNSKKKKEYCICKSTNEGIEFVICYCNKYIE